MTLTPETTQVTAPPEVSTGGQELSTRLSDPVHGQAERTRLRAHLQNLQAQLRAQAKRGLPIATYAQHRAARQAVDAALNILDKVSTGFSDPDASTTAGPIQSPVFFKR